MNSKYAPIGVFDSGVGGLTVVKGNHEALPNERVVYFAIRQSALRKQIRNTITKYTRQIIKFLTDLSCKGTCGCMQYDQRLCT